MIMSDELIERVMNRKIWDIPLAKPVEKLVGKRILITGAKGSIGQELGILIRPAAEILALTDIATLDVRNAWKVGLEVERIAPDVIFHLAGAKHAPAGELDPGDVARTNITGTENIVKAAKLVGAKVILASTCKACDPETAYGASKLIAERIVLNSGGSVARFYNVVDSSDNVFELWNDVPKTERIGATGCTRFFMASIEAASLLINVASLPPGRYAVNPGNRRTMWDVAAAFRPEKRPYWTMPRRGDREDEKLRGSSENAELTGWMMKITSPHEENS